MFNLFSKENPPLTNTVKFNEIEEFFKNIFKNYKDLSIIRKLGFEFLYNNDEYKDFYEYDINFYNLRKDFVKLFVVDDILKGYAKTIKNQIFNLIYPLPMTSPFREEDLKTCFDKRQDFTLQNIDITLKMYEIITTKDLCNEHVTFLLEKK